MIVTGGYNNQRLKSSELFSSSCYIPDLPTVRTAHVTFFHQFLPNSKPRLVTCGGLVGEGGCCSNSEATKECLVLDMEKLAWISHAEDGRLVQSLNVARWRASAVSMPVGVYVLGGESSSRTSDFLQVGQTSWVEGPDLPISFRHACACAISSTMFLIMRRDSSTSSSSIREYDTSTAMGPTSNEGWQPANTWPDLLNKRYAGMGCAVLGTKLVVAGGSGGPGYQRSTEIINLETRTIEYGEDMLQKRAWFHLLPISRSGEPLLWAVGGWSGGGFLNSVEQWNPKTGGWSEVEGQLFDRRGDFGAVAVEDSFCRESVSTTELSTTAGILHPSSTLLIGGDPWTTGQDVDLFPSDSSCQVAPLPNKSRFHSSFVRASGQMVTCGGRVDYGEAFRNCTVLNVAKGVWETGVVGNPKWWRANADAVSLSVGVYLVQGDGTFTTDFLASKQNEWVWGPTVPLRTSSTCAVAISQNNFLVVGARHRQIREYDTTNMGGPTSNQGWQPDDTWPELLMERNSGYACGVLGTTMVIAGGSAEWSRDYLKSTELVDLAAKTTRRGPDLRQTRAWFHLLPIQISPEDPPMLLALGGYADSQIQSNFRLAVEGWTQEAGNWTEVAQLSKARYRFGAFPLDKNLICPSTG